ncbi:9406_t:CDS:2 [Cetraspora pellucida]|uniref:9406_t:CDS:1 n=1 Tax=Cetraspora pellucida TaxID=1433469 RepID=A0A9N9EUL3_9GLOM|nr:9406_t:CDS:2 [Cetraspora pellucida]
MSLQENKLIPIDKLLKNFENESLKPQVILLTCGSYIPIHNFHIEIFEIAKEYLEKEKNYKVVLGYISPSQETYIIQKKYLKEKISLTDRIEMIKLVTNESSWIDITTWEVLSPKNNKEVISYHHVVKEIFKYLKKNEQIKQSLKERQLKLIYLCGLDQVSKKERTGLKHLEKFEIAIIERYLNDKNEDKDWKDYCKEKFKEMYKEDKVILNGKKCAIPKL